MLDRLCNPRVLSAKLSMLKRRDYTKHFFNIFKRLFCPKVRMLKELLFTLLTFFFTNF